jgi:hypothetical protein
MAAHKPARRAVAPTVPSLEYIWPAKRGNPAAKQERMNELLAMTDAAQGR